MIYALVAAVVVALTGWSMFFYERKLLYWQATWISKVGLILGAVGVAAAANIILAYFLF